MRGEDLTFRSVNGLFVFGKVWMESQNRFLWKVRCSCGKVRAPMTTTHLKKYNGKRGCRCPSEVQFQGDIATVDCSTPKYPNISTVMYKEDYLKNFKDKKLSGYQLGNSPHIYVGCEGVPVHITINATPKGFVTDHISGDTLDNRGSNLRIATKTTNGQNSKINCDNTSGFSGVSFRKDTRKWVAKITVNRKVIWLGTNHPTKVSAIVARLTAEMQYGFHENHGRKTS